MSAFGLMDMRFGKFKTDETEAAMPTYETPVSLGPSATANMTVTTATAEDYGDNVLQVKISEFVSAAIPAELNDCPKEALALVVGAAYDAEKKEISYAGEDSAPLGGLSYIRTLKRKGSSATIYEAHFYTKVQGALGNENAQTKGSSITFQHATINFTAYPPLMPGGAWHNVAEFDTLAGAQAYINEKFTPTPGA